LYYRKLQELLLIKIKTTKNQIDINKILLITAFLSTFLFPQLKVLELKPVTEVGVTEQATPPDAVIKIDGSVIPNDKFTPVVVNSDTARSDSSDGMVWVEGGTFTMGSNDGQRDEKPTHQVTLNGFFIGKTEVTQELWERVMGSNPAYFKGSRKPMEQVSWYDAVEFCNKLSEKEGLQKAYRGSGSSIKCDFNANGYRLPTEAEWEYAARGGNKSKGYKFSGSNTIGNVAWYTVNSGDSTHEAGTKSPNELGIYEMSGNVWEWCWDWYGGNYSASSSDTNPKGTNSGSLRVLRGGSCNNVAESCRVANRGSDSPDYGYYNNGFRLARSR
jgi:formylglycine-generating enzyme required for sulfatase activity